MRSIFLISPLGLYVHQVAVSRHRYPHEDYKQEILGDIQKMQHPKLHLNFLSLSQMLTDKDKKLQAEPFPLPATYYLIHLARYPALKPAPQHLCSIYFLFI